VLRARHLLTHYVLSHRLIDVLAVVQLSHGPFPDVPLNDPVLKSCCFRKLIKKTNKWVKFGAKGKPAIEATRSRILAAQPAAT